MEEDRKVCGKCEFCIYSPSSSGKGTFYCDNYESENYGAPTFYYDSCEDFEDRDKK